MGDAPALQCTSAANGEGDEAVPHGKSHVTSGAEKAVHQNDYLFLRCHAAFTTHPSRKQQSIFT